MTFNKKTKTLAVGNQTITFETGQVARQANGAVIARSGETMVFASACAGTTPSAERSFLPLRVDYQEKFSSSGKTLGGFIKREGKPSERETLVCRLIDRPIRPLFPEGYYNDTQLLTFVWSYDKENAPDVLAICAASAALLISDIPFTKPLAAVRVGHIDGEFVVNPTKSQMEKSELDLVLAGTEEAILMIEGYCDFFTEEQVLEAIAKGHEAIKLICRGLHEWMDEVAKEKHHEWIYKIPEELPGKVAAICADKLKAALNIQEKKARGDEIALIQEEVMNTLYPEGEEPLFDPIDVKKVFKATQASVLREQVLTENRRADGRTTTDIRPIVVEPSFLPRTHGSTLFTRGETQSMAVCTLGSQNMAQRYEDLLYEGSRRFYLQYSFPPFSVGEVGRMGPPGRREVGHGKLAERALSAAVPSSEEFPYVMRVESNITESNGSSSMASVCGGCIAMMDAGVPIKRPVAGIAMGLILEGDRCAVLSDILGIEDALGDMDFKITGDSKGITAFQMDIKVEGITQDIMAKALAQAKDGLVHILDIMLEACPQAREMSKHAPRIISLKISSSKIGKVVGPGGKQIRAIIEDCGVDIDISDDGTVSISGNDPDGVDKARRTVEGLTAEVVVNNIYEGKIVSIAPFGAFVEILPGQEGLCHVSELDHQRIEDVKKHFKEGETITVKVLGINERGQMKLSRKVLLPKPSKSTAESK